MKSKTTVLSLLFFVCALTSMAQEIKIEKIKDTVAPKPQKAITHGSVTVAGNRINYQAIAGTMILKNEADTPTISMSYVAYFKENDKVDQRPVTFIYNGGPGSSTVWLHMGAFGPQRVYLTDSSRTEPHYKTDNNN